MTGPAIAGGIVGLVFLMLVVGMVVGQPDLGDVQIQATHVGGTVYRLEGRGGNIGASVGEDGILLIDDQFAPLADKIRAALSELGGGDIVFLLNTHFHRDHVGCNPIFGKEATIIAQENVRKRLSTPERAGEQAMDPAGWPVVTFGESLTLYFNGERIAIIHLRHAHTDGDAMVYFTGSNVLHAGDILFSGTFPYVDLNHGGTIDGFRAGLKWILDNMPKDVKIIAGHGPLSTIDDVRASYEMIAETVAIVRERIDAGESLEAIQKQGLPARYEHWSGQFIDTGRWIETIYDAYSR